MRKRCLTLLEVVIALSLTAILLSVLFGAQWSSHKAQAKIEAKKREVLPRQRLQLKLFPILTSAKAFRLDENGGLIVEYSGQLDRDARFRGPLTSLLRLQDNSLCLFTWPEDGIPRTEVLLENVECLSFRFFYPSKKKFDDFDPEEKATMLKIKAGAVEFPFFL